MSLISDTNFLIHNLRLSYLRDVEDPYGSRLITFDPSSYNSNQYIMAASLADVDRWPELEMPSSPQLTDEEGERPSGFPGARLKYTTTIMGRRTGGLGLRTTGKRTSTSKRMSGTPRQADVKNFISENAPVQGSLTTTVVTTSLGERKANNLVKLSAESEKGTSSSQPNVQIIEPTAPEEAPVAKVVQFIPKFKGAAEMEARRRVRMAARRGPGGASADPPPMPPTLDSSSSEEDDNIVPSPDDSSDSDFGEAASADDSMDDGDEFDPDFASTRTPGMTSDSASDVISVLSTGTNSIVSVSSSSVPLSSSHHNGRSRPRLSPVSEGPQTNNAPPQRSAYFDTIVPAPNQAKKTSDGAGNRSRNHSNTSAHVPSPSISSVSADMSFARKQVAPIKFLHSPLSAMLASSGESSNPFAETYASISGRGEAASTNVQVFFPHAREPAGRAMDLNVRKDATVEEVIGFALWNYWEEGWLPKLDDGLGGDEDPKRATRISAVGWILRIAEDDGEVDDDFPPPDRAGKVAKFNADAYAVLEATPAQVQQNQVLESKIMRHPSRTTASKKVEKAPPAGLVLPSVGGTLPSSQIIGSALGSVPLSTSLGPSSGQGPQMFLKINVENAVDAVHISTTIPVSSGMYMQEVLENVCKKRKLSDPKDFSLLLVLDNQRILIPLDRTVASLQGKSVLVLVKTSMMAPDLVKRLGKTTDPNASILPSISKRMSDAPEVKFSSALDYTAAYKKYTITRKMPMLVARQERILAIDGVYIHIMPSASKAKAVFDSGKTLSYHIKSIAECQQSAKSSALFKLVLGRAGGNKRYDFEAESPKLAGEIVQTIRTLKAAVERSGTVNKSRRSRHA